MIAMEAQARRQSNLRTFRSPYGLNCGEQLIAEESIVAKNIK
jgi:hypothetical protein